MLSNVLHLVPVDQAPNQIRALRMTRKMSQQALADGIHVSKVTISSLEVGRMQLTLDYMRRIARVFGVAPVDLLNLDDQNEFLRAEEMALIRYYRSADPLHREMINRVAEPRVGALHAVPDQKNVA